ncbi:MAG: methylaspartate ammonia-lyase [Tissierella sp.]|uniref:methylaspartate ammonia-lyase n=1 Tax=Tissierella sp. TaxID=41274 RepID=UPI003F979142
MKIVDIICSEGKTGFYFDDQKAIKQGAKNDGMFYLGEPVTEGFDSIRQPGESISVMIVLEDGQVALGDCAAVQYSGAGGRDPLFLAKDFIPIIEGEIKDRLVGKETKNFKELAEEIDGMKIDGKKLHTAIRYGLTQSILDASAKAQNITKAEVIKKEYKTDVDLKRIPIFTQSGDDRYLNADKMIIKQADVMPHGLFNNVEEKLGLKGEKLKGYVEWLTKRVLDHRADENYNPTFHIDVYGTIGELLDNDIEAMTKYLGELEEVAKPFTLRIEGPMDVGERTAQMEAMRDLRKSLEDNNISVELVADEWCNTLEDVKYFAENKAGHMIQIKSPDLGGINNSIEAILFCNQVGVASYLGGTCNETSVSSEICTNIAIACGAGQVLAKPGMGVDEGIMLVNNEMNRVLALANSRK